MNGHGKIEGLFLDDFSASCHRFNVASGLAHFRSPCASHEVEKTNEPGEQNEAAQANQDLEGKRFEANDSADIWIIWPVVNGDLPGFQSGLIG